MKIINLTPHVITLRDKNGNEITIESTGRAKLVQTPGEVMEIHGLPVPVAMPAEGGHVEGVGEPEDETVYIVSFPVAQFLKRPDVMSPGTSPQDGAVRDDNGRIVAVTRLIRHA